VSASPLIRLDAETIEAIAGQTAARVMEMLQGQARSHDLVDAARLAQALGVSRDTVYAHVTELGGRRIGAGPRGRLRFDLDAALERWTCRSVGDGSPRGESPAQAPTPPARGRRPTGSSEQLLPIRGPSPITTAPESS
jgi:hypothetical protein